MLRAEDISPEIKLVNFDALFFSHFQRNPLEEFELLLFFVMSPFIGRSIRRSFGPLGVHTGRVTSSRVVANSTLYLISYDDGDNEELDGTVVEELLQEGEFNDDENDEIDDKGGINGISRSSRGAGGIDGGDGNENGDKKDDDGEMVEKWQPHWCDKYERFYYYNPQTKETTWVMPDNFVDVQERDGSRASRGNNNNNSSDPGDVNNRIEALAALHERTPEKPKLERIGASSLSLDQRLQIQEDERMSLRLVKRKLAIFAIISLMLAIFAWGGGGEKVMLTPSTATSADADADADESAEATVTKLAPTGTGARQKEMAPNIIVRKDADEKQGEDYTTELRGEVEKVKHAWRCNVPLVFSKTCKEIRTVKKKAKRHRKIKKMKKMLEREMEQRIEL